MSDPQAVHPSPSGGEEARLFLSADILGSTKLKEKRNIQALFQEFKARQKLLKEMAETPGLGLSREGVEALSNNSFFPERAIENAGWMPIIENQFADFHSAFISEVDKAVPESGIEVWKCLGDEILYTLKIVSYEQVYNVCFIFMRTLQSFDAKARATIDDDLPRLRMKGTGWVALFPVRNRVCTLFGRKDYLGQDIDLGFRIAKFSYPGIMCVSLDLAYLLGTKEAKDLSVAAESDFKFKGEIIGWEPLKGIWGDRHYPIVWIVIVDGVDIGKEFPEWETASNKLAEKWRKGLRNTKNMMTMLENIQQFYKTLGKELGIMKPYIPGVDETPGGYSDLLAFFQGLNQGDSGGQLATADTSEDPASAEDFVTERTAPGQTISPDGESME